MRRKQVKLWLVGLMVLLVGTACVQVDSEIRLNSDGVIEEMRSSIVLHDASVLSLVNVPAEQLEEYATFWAMTKQLAGFRRDRVAGVEFFVNLNPIREAGLDLEAEDFWEEFTIIRDHGKDPETGHIYVEYVFDLAEMFADELFEEEEFGFEEFIAELQALRSDPFTWGLMGARMQSLFEYNLITRMPGKVVYASHGETLPGQPNVHSVTVNFLSLLDGPLTIRVVADPEQRVLPYEKLDIQPHPAMQKDVWEAGRFWLNDQVAVQDVTFRAGAQTPEISGQLYNSGDQSYQWVSLGLSLFDNEGRFIDHYTLLIQHVGAGEERGFRKRLFDGDLSDVAFYRLEWAMGY